MWQHMVQTYQQVRTLGRSPISLSLSLSLSLLLLLPPSSLRSMYRNGTRKSRQLIISQTNSGQQKTRDESLQAGDSDRARSPRDCHTVIEHLRRLLVLVARASAPTSLEANSVHSAVDKGLSHNLGDLMYHVGKLVEAVVSDGRVLKCTTVYIQE